MTSSGIVADLQKPNPSAVIELFRLELNQLQHGETTVYRFHAGTNLKNEGDIVWAGQTYNRFPVEAEGFEYTGTGQLPRPKIRISNIIGTVSTLLRPLEPNTSQGQFDGIGGAKVIRIRTLAKFLDAVNFPNDINPFGVPDPTAEFPREIYFVDRKTIENRDLVEFELVSAFDLAGVRAPKRQCIANICQWGYRSTECGYQGTNYFDENDQAVGTLAQDVCSKRLTGCKIRFGQNAVLPYGSFPGIGTYFV